MPPGMAHEVFTPIASVMVGTHFLMYDTMPATELAMHLDMVHGNLKTNNDHPAVFTMVAHMTLALPLIHEGMLRSIDIHALILTNTLQRQ